MKILNRYIFKEVSVALLMSVFLFVFILVTGNALKDVFSLLASGRLSLVLFFKLLLLLIPYVISYALPLGMACSVLLVFGRLSNQKEIVAMRSCGLSLYRISLPAFLVAGLGLILCLLINLYYAPAAKAHYREGIVNSVRANPVQFIQPQAFINDFPGFRLYVSDRNGYELSDVWIWELDDAGKVKSFIKAREAYLAYDEAANRLNLTLVKGIGEKRSAKQIEEAGNVPLLIFNNLTLQLPLDKLFRGYNAQRKLSMLTFTELLAKRVELLELEKAGDESAFAQRIRVQLQMQKDIVMAFAMIVLAIMALPLAIKTSRAESYANIALALSLSIVYYFLTITVGWLENMPQLRPDLLIWLPSLIFVSVGGWLSWRIR
jgi:lipopolysaccharide export system permease protein